MRRLVLGLLIAGIALGSGSLAGAQGSIHWASRLYDARKLAAKERRMIFLARNASGSRANDMILESGMYRDPTLVKLSRYTANVFCSPSTHGKSRCPKVRGLRCAEHRNCEQKLRSRILKVSAGAWLPTPEHVFAWPDGQVQSSVPGRITRGELEWVWVDAIRSTDPSFVWQLGPKARAPRALRYGYEAPSLREQRPPAKEQVDEALEQLEKGGPRIFRTAWELYPLIIRSEDPRAMRWVASTLSSRWVNGRLKVRSIEPIGQTSPQIWWKVVEPYAGHHDARVRYAAVVAIEKLASPEAVERLLRQWKSKKELPEIRARILRALGACGHDDRRASRVLERVLQSKQSEDLRANAMAGVADIDERRTFQKLVKLGLSDPSAIIRAAAAYAVAVHRDREMLEHVEIVAEQEKDAETRHWMATAIRIVREKGDLSAFDEFVASLAGNDAPAQERPDRGGGRGSRRASGRGRDKGSGKGGQSS